MSAVDRAKRAGNADMDFVESEYEQEVDRELDNWDLDTDRDQEGA
jgi:hypothetical protein